MNNIIVNFAIDPGRAWVFVDETGVPSMTFELEDGDNVSDFLLNPRQYLDRLLLLV